MDEINNFENTPIQQVQVENKSNYVAYIVLIALIIVGGVATYFNFFYQPIANNTNSLTLPILSSAQEKIHSVAYYENLVLQETKLNITSIINQKDILQTNLPIDLQKFILGNQSNLVTQEVIYANKQTGFVISYQVSTITLIDLMHDFINIATKYHWSFLGGQRAELASILEYENNQYEMRILYSTESNSSPVKIFIQITKK